MRRKNVTEKPVAKKSVAKKPVAENMVEKTMAETPASYEVAGDPREGSQVTWTKLGDYAIADFPSGKQVYFKYTLLEAGLMRFYGAKQWLSDKRAGKPVESEAVAAMKAAFDDAVKSGLELSSGGKISVRGRTRASQKSALKAADSMIDLLLKQQQGTITEDEAVILEEMIERRKA